MHPFSPSINGSVTARCKLSETVERLLKYKLDTENSLEKQRAINRKNEIFDGDTGKVLFTPQINESKRGIREKPVWQELYEESNRKIIFPEKPQKLLINENSKKITEKIRYRQYEVIFNSLSPVNGRISYECINFKIADTRLLEILHPIIQELQYDISFTLTFEEFCETMETLIKILTPQEKWYLIFSYKNPLP